MTWKPLRTMPRNRVVQIGNAHRTDLAERKRDTRADAEWIEVDGEMIDWEETTATHWREYDAPPKD